MFGLFRRPKSSGEALNPAMKGDAPAAAGNLAVRATTGAAKREVRTGTGYAATIKEYHQQHPVAVVERRLPDRFFELQLPSQDRTELPFTLTTPDGQAVKSLCTLHIGDARNVRGYMHPAMDGKIEHATTSFVVFQDVNDRISAQGLTAKDMQTGTAVISESTPINAFGSPEGSTALNGTAMNLRASYMPDHQSLWIEMRAAPTAEFSSIPYVLTVNG